MLSLITNTTSLLAILRLIVEQSPLKQMKASSSLVELVSGPTLSFWAPPKSLNSCSVLFGRIVSEKFWRKCNRHIPGGQVSLLLGL